MRGRPRNDDRKAIEAFARIHRGAAGASPSRVSRPGPDAARSIPGPGPVDPGMIGYAGLPALPNLERPRMGRRLVVALTVTAIVIVVALGLAGATSGPHGKTGRLAANSAGSATGHGAGSAGSGTTRSRSGSTRSRSGSTSGSHAGAGRTTTSTVPTTGPVAPTSSSPTAASYVLPAGQAPLTVTIDGATGSCWAEAGPSAGAPLSWEGTVASGQQHVLAAAASWWLRLGAPEYARVTVNGRQLELPSSSQPLELTISTA